MKVNIAGNNMTKVYIACHASDCMKQFGSPYSPGVEPAVIPQTFWLGSTHQGKTQLMAILLNREYGVPLLVG